MGTQILFVRIYKSHLDVKTGKVVVPPNSSWNGWLWLVIISTTKDISWTKEWIPQHNSISNENYLRLVAVKCKSSNANMLVLTVATNFIQMSSSRRPSRAQRPTSLQMVGAGAENCLVLVWALSSWSGVCIYHRCYHFLLIADWSSGTVARAPACPGQHSWHAAHQTTDTGHHCVMSWGQLQWEQDI